MGQSPKSHYCTVWMFLFKLSIGHSFKKAASDFCPLQLPSLIVCESGHLTSTPPLLISFPSFSFCAFHCPAIKIIWLSPNMCVFFKSVNPTSQKLKEFISAIYQQKKMSHTKTIDQKPQPSPPWVCIPGPQRQCENLEPGIMWESWITHRDREGGWIDDNAFHKIGDREGLEVEWGEKKLGSRPLVFEELIGRWVGGVQQAIDYTYVLNSQ